MHSIVQYVELHVKNETVYTGAPAISFNIGVVTQSFSFHSSTHNVWLSSEAEKTCSSGLHKKFHRGQVPLNDSCYVKHSLFLMCPSNNNLVREWREHCYDFMICGHSLITSGPDSPLSIPLVWDQIGSAAGNALFGHSKTARAAGADVDNLFFGSGWWLEALIDRFHGAATTDWTARDVGCNHGVCSSFSSFT